MANRQQLNILKKGVQAWFDWRNENPDVAIDLRGAKLISTDLSGIWLDDADLSNANLTGVDLSGALLTGAKFTEADLSDANLVCSNSQDADFRKATLDTANLTDAHLNDSNFAFADLSDAYLEGADLTQAKLSYATITEGTLDFADLTKADLSEADLSSATLNGANLTEANLTNANLTGASLNDAIFLRANLTGANLRWTSLRGANLEGADLIESIMVKVDLEGAKLNNCYVYGCAAWDLQLKNTEQSNLIITDHDTARITVDNLQVAQFIYLLLNNEKIRDVIDTIGKKGVLILGRFTPERKAVLDALRIELRRLGYVPMLFDFEKPTDKDFTETIMTLAGLSLFIIADITNPKSSPLELQATVPNYMIPFVPIIQEGERPFSMFKDLRGKFVWVLDPLVYDSASNLTKGLERGVVIPALKRHDELMRRKAEELPTRHIGEYLKDS